MAFVRKLPFARFSPFSIVFPLRLLSSFKPQYHARYFASSSTSTSSSGIIEFKLADIGEGIAECEILKWYVKPGDKIKQFDKVCEVQSDKATVEITSRYDGVVQAVHYQVGAMAKVGKSLISIAGVAAENAKNKPVAAAPSSSGTVAAAPVVAVNANHGEFHDAARTTPAVRRIAKENNIDLAKVTPSGPDGRILKEDVLNFISGHTKVAAEPIAAVSAAVAPVSAPAVPRQAVKAQYHFPILDTDKTVNISGLARIMVSTMNAANAIPHFGFCEEIVMDELIHVRASLKNTAEKHHIKLSYMPFIIKAVSLALREYPILNAHANADASQVVLKASHNIGIAMNTPRGLIVPNVKNVQNKSIFEIASNLTELQELGRENKLGKEHLTGGTFSLSNIGTIGGTYASPLLVVPEVAIAAIGRLQTVPRYNHKKEIHPVTTMAISYSGDHRVIDGATMANFSNLMKKYLEQPATMIGVMH